MSLFAKPIKTRARYDQLLAFARKQQILYYYGGGGEIPDHDYDTLEQALTRYEQEHGITGPGAISQSVAPGLEEAQAYFAPEKENA